MNFSLPCVRHASKFLYNLEIYFCVGKRKKEKKTGN